ncbi:hypothetical protein ACFQ1S_09150, partial [Kibdelosporangium lantanae]
RDPSRNPLFQVSFTLQSGAAGVDFELNGLRSRPVEIPGETARFDIAFQIDDLPDGGGLIWIEYSTELFSADRMRDLAAQGMTMLVVTHEMRFAREVAQQVAFLDHGRLVEIAPPEQFFDDPRSERLRTFLDQVL